MSSLHLAVLIALLGAACASDLATRRIPNLLVALLAGTGLASQGASGGTAVLGALLASLGIFVAMVLPWMLGKLGGGDLKLAVAAAVWAGSSHVVAFAFLMLFAGIPVALATAAVHRISLHKLVREAVRAGVSVGALSPPRPTVPVAVAISLALLIALRGVGMS